MTDGEHGESAEVREARRLLATEWRTDADAILEGARRLIALGPRYAEEAVTRLGLVFSSNQHVGSARRIEAARIRASLGGDHVKGAAGSLRLVAHEYRGYVEQWENIDGAYALARLAPQYVAQGAWLLRDMLCSSVQHLDDWDRAYALPRLAALRGAGFPPELPYEGREFPVHGLAHGAEERWLEGWGTVKGDPEQPLWYVSHGYRTAAGATVVVSTWRPVDINRYGFHGLQQALAQARVDSLAGALHLAFPTDPGQFAFPAGPDGNPEAEAAFREAGLVRPGYTWPTTLGIEVDGRRAEFEIQWAGDAWAAAAEVGPLVIGVYGRGGEPGTEPLVRVLP
ncbi:hypothetical protein ACH47Z_32455 [Streptomyces sp. NPDC020192]|uniref:hypothetical protein n=1 Tax=Streptomyces sp. NPDC020192 TaxID=3365066 RepID=UPI0037B83F13